MTALSPDNALYLAQLGQACAMVGRTTFQALLSKMNLAEREAYRPRGYPISASSTLDSSRITESSIVGGAVYGTPSAIFLIVPRTIFPESHWATA